MWKALIGVLIIVLVLVIYLSVVATSRFANYYMSTKNLRYPKVKYSEYKTKLKDGDILLFINRTHGMTNSIFTNSLFSHSGMIVNIDGGLAVSESTTGNYIDKNGESQDFPSTSQINDLEWRIDEYPGQLFIIPLKNPLNAQQKEILHQIIHIKTSYPNSVGEWIKHVFSTDQADQSRHCMQHVNWLLDKMEMRPKNCSEKLFKVGVFRTTNKLTSYVGKKMGSYSNTYMPIIELVYDEFD